MSRDLIPYTDFQKGLKWNLFYNKWDKVFKNRPSKICGRQPLKDMKDYDLFRQAVFHKFYLADSWMLCPKCCMKGLRKSFVISNNEYHFLCHHCVILNTIIITAALLKVTLPHGSFSRFLNCTNGIKSRNESDMIPKYLRRSRIRSYSLKIRSHIHIIQNLRP